METRVLPTRDGARFVRLRIPAGHSADRGSHNAGSTERAADLLFVLEHATAHHESPADHETATVCVLNQHITGDMPTGYVVEESHDGVSWMVADAGR